MNIPYETRRAIDIYAEQIHEDGTARDAANDMVRVGLKNTQLRGLETLVGSTPRFSEIINYIKNQAGKDRKHVNWSLVASKLLEQLGVLEKKAGELGKGDPERTLAIKIKMARLWVKQVVTHYLYEKSRTGS